MTAALSARVEALEAWQMKATALLVSLATTSDAMTELWGVQYALQEMRGLTAAPPPPADPPAPDLERVRKELVEMLERPEVLRSNSYYRQTVGDVLRLLGSAADE